MDIAAEEGDGICRVTGKSPINKRKQLELESQNGSDEDAPVRKRARIVSEEVDASALTTFFDKDPEAVIPKTKIQIWHNGRIKSIAFFPLTSRTALEEHIRATFGLTKTRTMFVLVDNDGDEIPLTNRLPDGLKLSLRTIMKRPEDTPTRIWLHFQKQYKSISDAIGNVFCSDLNLLVAQYAVPVRTKGAKIDLWCQIARSWWVGTVLNTKKDKVQVHFDGWETRYHEWLPFDHERLADLNTHTTHRVPTFDKSWQCPVCLCICQDAWKVRCDCSSCPGVRPGLPDGEYWKCPQCKFNNAGYVAHCDACAFKDLIVHRPPDYKQQNQPNSATAPAPNLPPLPMPPVVVPAEAVQPENANIVVPIEGQAQNLNIVAELPVALPILPVPNADADAAAANIMILDVTLVPVLLDANAVDADGDLHIENPTRRKRKRSTMKLRRSTRKAARVQPVRSAKKVKRQTTRSVR